MEGVVVCQERGAVPGAFVLALSFDHPNRFGPGRAAVTSTRGMVATSQPLAALTGVSMMQAGGNAIDAAVAAAAMLAVIEPMSTGPGGDAFGIIYDAKTGKAYGLNSSGRSGRAAGLEEYKRRLSLSKVQQSVDEPGRIPGDSMLAVTVPGIVAGWEAAVKRFGRMTIAELLAPAIRAAEEGFAVSPYVARAWETGTELLKKHPESAKTWFLSGGSAPRAGQTFRNPDLGRTLRSIVEGGAAAFYSGQIADRISRFSESNGGALTQSDLADHTYDWVEPVSSDYRGYQILEMPPNGQGIAVLEALRILEHCDFAAMGHNQARTIHLQMEAIRLAMADARTHVTDPDHLEIDIM